MSGGHFDYKQYDIQYIVDCIEDELEKDTIKPEWEDITRWSGHRWTEATRREFREAIKVLKKAKVYAHRIDWLLSGDDDEEYFHKRLKEDLEEVK